MSNKIYAIKYIFLTHGHIDHISGLWTIVNTRNNSMGDREKPLYVYYPAANKAVEEWIEFIKRTNSDLRFDLVERPLAVGERVFLRQAGGFCRYVIPFKVRHTGQDTCFGYNIVELRRRLKEEYRNLPQNEIANLSKKLGVNEITEVYEKKLLTISGDTYGIDPQDAQDSEILIHDCTFLKSADRKMNAHASIEEVLEIAKKANVAKLILYHISSRYSGKIEKYLKNFKNSNTFEVMYVDPENIFTC